MAIRILVVGNTLRAVESARPELEPLDCLIIRAPGSALALYPANKNFPDLILCNPDMPDGTGMEFLSQIKADTELGGIPFVFVCSQDKGQAFYADAMRLGSVEVIVEPSSGSRLLSELRLYLRAHRLEREPESPE